MFDGVSYPCKASKKQMGNGWTQAYTMTFFSLDIIWKQLLE
jgi:hypothetical protein